MLQVVDGVQRLTTIFQYVTQKSFALGPVTYLHDLVEGRGFDDLAAMFRRRLNSAQFVAHVIDPQTPYRVKFEIFRRINTGGSPLSAQEIRHCMSGPSVPPDNCLYVTWRAFSRASRDRWILASVFAPSAFHL